MRYKYIHILAALFLIGGMGVQFLVSYRQAKLHVQETIDLKTEIAREKILFELYDAYDAVDQVKEYVLDHLSQPDKLFKETHKLLKHYPHFYSCYVSFQPYYYPDRGKWFCPCSYRHNGEICTGGFGDEHHDYFQREWYNGALHSGREGYWSKPYKDEDFAETIFTYSDDVKDKDGHQFCVIGMDFSLSWMQQLIEEFKPFDDALCAFYSSSGQLLTESKNLKGHDPLRLSEDKWLRSRQTLDPIGIELVIAVSKQQIWTGILWGILWPFIVFVLGILVVGFLIRHLWRNQERNARLETEKQVMSRELNIAHDIQMGILRRDFPNGRDVMVHADLLPMREVGGDLYDFNRQGDILWFIVGDVSGKGVPAAMFMSATVNLFRSALGHQSSPKAIVEEMNAVLSDNNPSLTFVTAFVGRLHIPSGQLLFCNAGHNLPLVKDAAGRVRSIEMTPNLPLGCDAKFQFEEERLELRKDETLVLYTDGVTEARNVSHQMMGDQLWMDMAAQHEDLLAAVKHFIGDAEPTDDITIMTIILPSGRQSDGRV